MSDKKDASKVGNNNKQTTNKQEEVPMTTATLTADQKLQLTAANLSDKDVQMYERMINNTGRKNKNGGTGDSPFSKVKSLMLAMVKVAETRGDTMIPVPNIINTALDQGWFDEIDEGERYNRCYNYFTHNKKALPKHWKVEKHPIDGKMYNHLVNKKLLP